MHNWNDFYKHRAGSEYLTYVKKRYVEHINAITCLIGTDASVELGCGTATITRALMDRGLTKTYIGLDNDQGMLNYARIRTPSAQLYHHNITKPFTIPFPHVVHSHGVLEHFDDDQIRNIINLHRGARAQVHYVPGLYPAPSFGDERLMPAYQWQEICNPDCIIIFNNGLDYCLVFNPA